MWAETGMNMGRVVRAIAGALAILAAAGPALAHSKVKETSPKSGAVLLQSPAEVTITFGEPARLTSVILAEAGMPERKLTFTPAESGTVFTVPEPRLGSGRNEIKWKALSKDGHPISGSIVITIRSGMAMPEGSARTQSQPEH
jgi:methionine-rich copper-binding protein CopC